MGGNIRWNRFPDTGAVAAEVVRRILGAAQEAVGRRGRFRLVLAGGSTPEQVYRLLAEHSAQQAHWHLYYGDERCLPPDDPGRNSWMVEQAWLKRGGVPQAQVHRIPAEAGPEQAAKRYEDEIRPDLPFDMVLLGMGEDGHTASLFPGQQHDPERLVVPVHDAPKPPPERVSLNYPALASSAAMMVLVTGAGKREAIRRWRAGERLPVASLECPHGIDVLLDDAAWAE